MADAVGYSVQEGAIEVTLIAAARKAVDKRLKDVGGGGLRKGIRASL